MTYRPNALKSLLSSGGKALGCWSSSGSPVVAELLSQTGFDYVLIDQEHGVGDNDTLVRQLQAMANNPATAVVRPAWNDAVMIKRILDAGAEGVMLPSIETAEQARQAVAACRYPPAGIRGAGWAGGRASAYGMIPDYATLAAERLLIVVQIETVKGVENIDEILKVDGVDVIFIGPADLTGSAGHLGDLHHPDVMNLVRRVEKATFVAGRPLGTVPFQRPWKDLFADGYAMVNAASDTAMLRDRSRADIALFREAFRAEK
jgi:4-hydroxy-2-oxoheptanedioate aldolase